MEKFKQVQNKLTIVYFSKVTYRTVNYTKQKDFLFFSFLNCKSNDTYQAIKCSLLCFVPASRPYNYLKTFQNNTDGKIVHNIDSIYACKFPMLIFCIYSQK